MLSLELWLEPISKWRKFLAQFTNILVVLLLVAALVSAAFWFYQRESPFPYESTAAYYILGWGVMQ